MSSSNILLQVYGILEAERKSDELTDIPISIYLDITNYIKSKKNGFGKVPVTVPEMIITKEREMLSSMSEKIMNIRLSKAIQNNQENFSLDNLKNEFKFLDVSQIENSFKKLNNFFLITCGVIFNYYVCIVKFFFKHSLFKNCIEVTTGSQYLPDYSS